MKRTPFVLAVLLLLAACKPAPPPGWTGYAEGELLYLSAPVAGRVQRLHVAAGDAVTAGQLLFEFDPTLEQAASAEAEARSRSAAAQAANTDKGRREAEIAVTRAQLAQARSSAQLAASDLARQEQLLAQGFVARARVDDAATLVRQTQARIAELEAALAVAQLPARPDERSSARALADAAEKGLSQAQWRVQEKRQTAPAAGRVTDVFLRPGEWANAAQPVLALLPPTQRKARFYVPQSELGGLHLGDAVRLACDGCGAPIEAKVSFIAPGPEYTPPVIYSNAQRQKLVFLVEARPVKPEDAERLHPGQPLDVTR